MSTSPIKYRSWGAIMIQLKSLIVGTAGLLLVLAGSNANAVIANPDPANLLDDAGADHFAPSTLTASIEIADPFDAFTSFGFYFLGAPGNRTTIFGPLDQAAPQVAVIDFSAGVVADADASEVEDTFAPSLNNIGFWFDIPDAGLTLFTQAALNPGGEDLSWVFTSKTDPLAHVLAFEAPDGTPLSVNVIGGFRAVAEPPTVLLMLAAVLMLSLTGFRSARTG